MPASHIKRFSQIKNFDAGVWLHVTQSYYVICFLVASKSLNKTSMLFKK